MRNKASKLVSSIAYISLAAGAANADYNSAPSSNYQGNEVRSEQVKGKDGGIGLALKVTGGVALFCVGLGALIVIGTEKGWIPMSPPPERTEDNPGNDDYGTMDGDYGRGSHGDGRI